MIKEINVNGENHGITLADDMIGDGLVRGDNGKIDVATVMSLSSDYVSLASESGVLGINISTREGLSLNDSSYLKVKISTGLLFSDEGEIFVDKKILNINIGTGLTMDPEGAVIINVGTGLSLYPDGKLVVDELAEYKLSLEAPLVQGTDDLVRLQYGTGLITVDNKLVAEGEKNYINSVSNEFLRVSNGALTLDYGDGLTSKDGKLVAIGEKNFINSVDSNGLSVDNNRLSLKYGTGLSVEDNTLVATGEANFIKSVDSKGLNVQDGNLSLKYGTGLSIEGDTLIADGEKNFIKSVDSKGLDVTNGALSLKYGTGLSVEDNTLVSVGEANYISSVDDALNVDNGKLSVKYGTGLAVDETTKTLYVTVTSGGGSSGGGLISSVGDGLSVDEKGKLSLSIEGTYRDSNPTKEVPLYYNEDTSKLLVKVGTGLIRDESNNSIVLDIPKSGSSLEVGKFVPIVWGGYGNSSSKSVIQLGSGLIADASGNKIAIRGAAEFPAMSTSIRNWITTSKLNYDNEGNLVLALSSNMTVHESGIKVKLGNYLIQDDYGNITINITELKTALGL